MAILVPGTGAQLNGPPEQVLLFFLSRNFLWQWWCQQRLSLKEGEEGAIPDQLSFFSQVPAKVLVDMGKSRVLLELSRASDASGGKGHFLLLT